MPGFSFTLGVSRLHMANWLCLSCRKFNTSTRETDRKTDCTLGWAQSLQVWCLPTVCLYLRLNWLNCMLLTQADSPYLVKTLFLLFQLYIRNIARHVGQFFNYSFSTVFKHADQRTWCLSYVAAKDKNVWWARWFVTQKKIWEVIFGHCLEKGRHFQKIYLAGDWTIHRIHRGLTSTNQLNELYDIWEDCTRGASWSIKPLFYREKPSVPFCALFSMKCYLQFRYNCYTNLFRSCLCCCFWGNSRFSCFCRTWTTWLPVVR